MNDAAAEQVPQTRILKELGEVNVKLSKHPRRKKKGGRICPHRAFGNIFSRCGCESSASVKTHNTTPALEGNRRTGRSSLNQEVSDIRFG